MSSVSDKGARVTAKIKGQRVDAVVLESAFSSKGNYMQTKLKIAVFNPLTNQWIVSVYPRPVQSYNLSHRYTLNPALDGNQEGEVQP